MMPQAADRSARRGDLGWLLRWAAVAPAGLFLAATYAVPLARLVLAGFSAGPHGWSLRNYQALLDGGTFLSVLTETLKVAAVVTLACAILGYILALWISALPRACRSAAVFCVAITFFTSILIRSYAWIAILGPNGMVNKLLLLLGLTHHRLALVFNETGLLVGLLQVELPLMVLPLLTTLRRIDPALTQAARSLGAGPAGCFLQVTLPLSLPGLATGCTFVFITTLGAYVTPAMLGGERDYMLAQAIELRVMSFNDFGSAAAQATVLLLVVLACLLAGRRHLGLGVPTPVAKVRDHMVPAWLMPAVKVVDGPGRAFQRPLLAVAGGLVLFQLVAPLAVVVMLAFSAAPYLTFPPPGYSLRWFSSLLGDAQWTGAAQFSMAVSAAASSLAVGLGAGLVLALRRAGPRLASLGAAITMLGISPMILPHMVIAVSLYFFFAGLGLVGNAAGFVLAYALLGLPFVVVTLGSAVRQLDPSLEDAAASLGAPPLRAFRQVVLPLMLPSFVVAFAFAFLAAFDDLVLAVFLSSADAVTLAMRMWEDVQQEVSPRIAAVAVLLFAAAALAWPAWHLGGWARRHWPHPRADR